MSFLLERDALNGKSGSGFMSINGENHELFQLKKFKSDAEFQTSDFKVVGTTLVQEKTTGVKYSGQMTIYYGSPLFLKILEEYQSTGKLPTIEVQVINDDPSTSVGKQIVVHHNVKLKKVPISMLDADADFLEEEVDFSFTSVSVLNYFNDPSALG